jgi:hypothetical protein
VKEAALFCLGALAVASTAMAQGRPSLCDPRATRAEVTVLAVSANPGCGHSGWTEAVIRVRLDRRISGPRRSRISFAVIQCAQLRAGQRMEMCLGQQRPSDSYFSERYDDFEADTGPRAYALILRTHGADE